MNFTDSEIESLRKILRCVYLSDWGSNIVEDARSMLAKLGDRAACEHCYGRKCKGECK